MTTPTSTEPGVTSHKIVTGTKVKFAGDRHWWLCRAADDRFAVLTRQADFQPAGTVYTIIDWQRAVRGPCDLIGQGWNFDVDSLDQDAAKLLRALQYRLEVHARLKAGEKSVTLDETSVQVSYRNNVDIRIEDTK